MVENKIKALFGTKTILHIDNPDHYDLIIPYTRLQENHRDRNNGDFCINIYKTCVGNLSLYKRNNVMTDNHKDYKFITSTELIGNKIYELW